MSQESYSPGLEGVIAGESSVSSLRPELRIRGYSMEDLANHARFEEVAYLLLHGELPTPRALLAFQRRLGEGAALPDDLVKILASLPAPADTMDVLRSGVSLLALWDDDAAHNDRDANLRKAERLVAQMPTVVATFHRLRHHLPSVAPREDYGHAENLLWMLTGEEPSDTAARALDVSMIVYAEQELNASAFTARVVASTRSDLHASITAAIAALKGPLHGGANRRVMEMLQEVGTTTNAEAWVRAALARKERIMGFGHRVYKQGDPRAVYLAPRCRELAVGPEYQAVEATAETIAQIVAQEKGLLPNVDWPSARIYHYLGLPLDLYTPLFAVSRVVGWCAHAIEQAADNRLMRPVARYIGVPPRPWIPIDER